MLSAAKAKMYSRLLFYTDAVIGTEKVVVCGEREEEEKKEPSLPSIFEGDASLVQFLLEMKVFEPLS